MHGNVLKDGRQTLNQPLPPERPDGTQGIVIELKSGVFLFFDPKQNLRASVPVAEYFVAMRETRAMRTWFWVDSTYDTLLTFYPWRQDQKIELFVSIEKVEVGQTFKIISQWK